MKFPFGLAVAASTTENDKAKARQSEMRKFGVKVRILNGGECRTLEERKQKSKEEDYGGRQVIFQQDENSDEMCR